MRKKILLVEVFVTFVLVFSYGCKKKEEPLSNWIKEEQLYDENADARMAAAKTLVSIGTPAVPGLIRVIQDESHKGRMEAVWALGEIKDKRAAKHLAEMLFNSDALLDPGGDLNLIVLQSLAEIGPDAKATDFLIKKRRNANEGERVITSIAFAASGGEKSLLKLLIDMSLLRAFNRASDANVPIGTAMADSAILSAMKLRKENAKDIVQILQKKYEGRAVNIDNGGYYDSLGLGYKGVSDMLAIHILKEIGKPAVSHLSNLLKHDNEDLRLISIATLCLIGKEKKEERAVCPHLIFALEDEEEDVRKLSASALKEITGEDLGLNPEEWNKWLEENRSKGQQFSQTSTSGEPLERVANNESSKPTTRRSVRASHILITTSQLDEKGKIAAKAKLEQLLQEIKGGASFESLAKIHSDCPSKTEGGDLGYFGKDVMVEEFENVAFTLNIGEVSDVVETIYGYHLIKVTDIRY